MALVLCNGGVILTWWFLFLWLCELLHHLWCGLSRQTTENFDVLDKFIYYCAMGPIGELPRAAAILPGACLMPNDWFPFWQAEEVVKSYIFFFFIPKLASIHKFSTNPAWLGVQEVKGQNLEQTNIEKGVLALKSCPIRHKHLNSDLSLEHSGVVFETTGSWQHNFRLNYWVMNI